GLEHALEGVHGKVGGELAVAHDVLPGGVHVTAVWGLGGGQEVDRPGDLCGVHGEDALPHGGGAGMGVLVVEVVGVLCGHHGAPALGDVLLYLLPVDRGDEVLVVLGGGHLQQGVGLLCVVGGEEEPAVGLA